MNNRKYQTMVMMDESTDRELKRVGKGNRSQGIRQLAAASAEQYKKAQAQSGEMDYLYDDGDGEILSVPD